MILTKEEIQDVTEAQFGASYALDKQLDSFSLVSNYGDIVLYDYEHDIIKKFLIFLKINKV